MKIYIFLVCCALAVKSSWCDSISVIGSKHIRPGRPYTVGFANPLDTTVKLMLSLQCVEDDIVFEKEAKLVVLRTSAKKYQIAVPRLNPGAQCVFTATNDGGTVHVHYDVTLENPKKTVSIFIQTDKPVYKPGDVLRFRVIVVDMDTKPVTNVKSIGVNIRNEREESVRQWTYAKLNQGVFESSYQMAASPVLGTWTITATVNDSFAINVNEQQFEVMEYVLPKFAVKVRPSKVLLVSDRKITLVIESYFTFGRPVEGTVEVKLYTDEYSRKSTPKTTKSISGRTQVEFALAKELEVKEHEDHTLVNVTVAVTDAITNFTVNITQQIPVYMHPYKISLIKTSPFYRPGSPYQFKLSVKEHNGLPVEGGQSIMVSVNDEEHEANLDGQGMVSFVTSTPDAIDNITISAEFDSITYDDIGTIEGREETSTQYLQIHSKQRIIAGKFATFVVSSNELIVQLTYFIVSRGIIVEFEHKRYSRKKITLKLKLTEAMAPKATLVVFTVKDGKFIADYLDMSFESFTNDFEFKLDDESYRPEQNIYVEGKAAKDSFVVLQAIDESALLLGHTTYALTMQDVLDDLDQYAGEVNEFDWFHSMGLFFRSDSIEEDISGSSRSKRSPYYRSGSRATRKPILLRIDFPEAWLWSKFSMNNSNTFEVHDFVPDTITSWHVSGFALSPSRGLGIMSHPRKFTVGKNFYMIAHLPYSIKRGEVALIQVTLYNFLGNTVITDVTLFNKNEEIEFIGASSSSNTNDKRWTKAITVPTDRVKSLSFLIKAKKLGEIAIKIEAANELTSDGLEHMLRVTPESRRFQKSATRFIEQHNENKDMVLKADMPREQDIDPGSINITLSIDHDLIGTVAQKLDSLITIPKASCDVNLLTLIPSVVVLDYLSSNETVSETIKQAAIDSLTAAYQNQLKCKSENGAFRTWTSDTNNKESVFLTALTVSTFITASKHIKKVDQTVINNALAWLAKKQSSNGCFEEDGEVIYAPMQNSATPLTAFVAATFMENQEISTKYSALIDKAIDCLVKKFHTLDDAYHIALSTYALSLSNLAAKKKENYLDKLLENTAVVDGERSWNEGSRSVEIAGYALLAHVAQGLHIQSLPVFKWLCRQRYASGEFPGVQSTFVGLKAVGKIAEHMRSDRNDYRINVRSEDSLWKGHYFDVNGAHSLDPVALALPSKNRNFKLNIAGSGYGIVQLSYQYHQHIGLPKQRFKLDVELLKTSNHIMQKLKVCLSYKPAEHYVYSNKAVVEVHLPSGFVVNDNAVRDLSYEIKYVERMFDGSAMYVYYSRLGQTTVCFEVTAVRKFKIAYHRPAHVVVYDTEDRAQFALATYEGIVLQVCDICEDEDCKTLRC